MQLVFCFLAALCEGYDVQAAGVAAAGIAGEFRATPAQLGLFFSAGGLGLALGAVVGGRIADRVGRKAVLVASIATFGVLSMAITQATDMTTLTCMRVLMGLGLGGAMPNLIALAADASRSGSRNASIATTYIGMPLGGTIASLVVVAITPEEWRNVFWIGGAIPLAIAVMMALFMPATPAALAPVRDAASRAASPHPASSFAADLFGEGRLRSTLLLWIGFFLCVLTLHLMLNWLPLLLQGRGLSKAAAATAQAAFNVGGAAGGLLTGALLDTRRRALAIVTNIVLLPVVLLLLAISPSSSVLLIALASLLGVSVLSLQVILYGVAGLVYTPATRGTGMGAAVGWGRMGSIAGPTFAALLVGAGRTPAQVLLGVLPIAVLCGVAVATLGRCHYREQGLTSG